jgi:predicted porin
MKKSLLALAALGAFSGIASAQSSVTLFGIVDATLAIGRGSVADRTQLTNSGYNSSRLGFRGVEDMGGGLRAGFWLEAGINNDNGSFGTTSTNNQTTGASGGGGMTFNRRSTVSVGAGWGELRLGRDYTPHFWNQTVYDPFGTNGVGTTQTLNSSLGGPTTVRASNSITYLYGHGFNSTYVGGNGLHFAAQYYMGENASNAGATKSDGRGQSFRIGYGAGPLSVAFASGSTKYATGKITTTNFAGSFDAGMAQFMGIYDRDKVSGGNTGKGYLLGALVPIGQNQIRLAWSTYKIDTPTAADPKSNKLALGYVYNLSRRTALYTTYARVSNSGGAASALNGAVTAANRSSTGMDFGIRHSF